MEKLPELSYEKYKLLAERYWVLAWKSGYCEPHWSNWIMSTKEPKSVPNPQMFWRRPTYQDALSRQMAFERDPEYFEKSCVECSLREYDAA